MQATFAIANGASVQCKVTGFEGVVTGRVDYITGCNQYLVQPKVKADGTVVEPRWIDEHRLSVQAHVAVLTLVQGDRPGADASAPVK